MALGCHGMNPPKDSWCLHLKTQEYFSCWSIFKSLVKIYGKHVIYLDGGTCYPEACNSLGLTHILHSPSRAHPNQEPKAISFCCFDNCWPNIIPKFDNLTIFSMWYLLFWYYSYRTNTQRDIPLLYPVVATQFHENTTRLTKVKSAEFWLIQE